MPFNLFGGEVVEPSQVSYTSLSLTANMTMTWPDLTSNATQVVADIIEVTPSGGGFTITLPPANQRSVGQQILFRNVGASSFTVNGNAGGLICTIAAGVAQFLYIKDNSTAAGVWGQFTYGTGTSAADAAALAGYGIKAITTTLNQKHDVVETTSNITIDATYRAKTLVWTAGTLNCTLPTAASAGSDFFFIAKNGGTGTITFVLSGADTIDGASSLALAPNDGCIVYSGGGSNFWWTVGIGRSVSFAFTQLVKNVAGGVDVTLTSAECANKIISFVGIITANINVIVTNTVSVYYVYNNTTGAFTLTVKTAAGTGVVVAQGLRDILVCDTTNIYSAVTNTATTTAFASGSESSPSITFIGDTDTGFYHPGANQVAATAGGTDSMRWNTTVSAVNAIDVFPSATGTGPYIVPFGGDANINIGVASLGTGAVDVFTNTNVRQFSVLHTASAVNYITATGSTAGLATFLSAAGTDTNIQFGIASKGTSPVLFRTNGTGGSTQLSISHTGSAVNFWQFTGSATGTFAGASLQGADTNISAFFTTKGTGLWDFYTSAGSAQQFRIAHVASSVNYIQVAGGAAGGNPSLRAQGSDTDVTLDIFAKGAGAIRLLSNGTEQARISNTASSVNYVVLAGGATGNAALVGVRGSDTNVNMIVNTQGTGVITFATAAGADVQFRIANVTSSVNFVQVHGAATAGPVSVFATGSDANVGLNISSRGTGTVGIYTGGDSGTLQFRVVNVTSAVNFWSFSGSATGTACFMQATGTDTNVPMTIATKGTGSSADIVLAPGNIVAFRARTGSASNVNYAVAQGAIAGGAPSIGMEGGDTDITFKLISKGAAHVDLCTNTSSANIQLRAATVASAVNFWQFSGSATGNSVQCVVNGTDTNVGANFISRGTGALNFSTNSSSTNTQMSIAHTASAVNFLRVTGGATADYPHVSGSGSDTDVGIIFDTKGAGGHQFRTGSSGTNIQFLVAHVGSAVNYIQATGAAAAAGPTLTATGSDTNIDINLLPKGTGAITVNSTNPTFTTTSTGTLTLFNTGVTTVTQYGAATTFTMGGTATVALTANIFNNATSAPFTKSINIGVGGASGAFSDLTVGSATAGCSGTFTINHTAMTINRTATITHNVAVTYSCVAASNTLTFFNTTTTTVNAFGAATTIAIGAAASTQTYTGQAFNYTGANSTNNTALTVENTSNAAAVSHSYVDVKVGGTTSTGSPHVRLTIPGGTSWYVANDNAGNDWLVIGTGTTIGGGTQIVTINSSTISLAASTGGTDNVIQITNQSNTAGSGAKFSASVAGTSAGDPYMVYGISGGTSWTIGADNSVSDQFCFSTAGTGPGATDVMRITTAGVLSTINKIYPSTDAAAFQSSAGLYAGSGAPNNANGSDGDFYFRSDGTAGSNNTIYKKSAGAWAALTA